MRLGFAPAFDSARSDRQSRQCSLSATSRRAATRPLAPSAIAASRLDQADGLGIYNALQQRRCPGNDIRRSLIKLNLCLFTHPPKCSSPPQICLSEDFHFLLTRRLGYWSATDVILQQPRDAKCLIGGAFSDNSATSKHGSSFHVQALRYPVSSQTSPVMAASFAHRRTSRSLQILISPLA
jgi:hypothetical protein